MVTTLIYIFVSMKSIVILANGQFPRKEFPLYLLRSADAVVCCDGALMAAQKHGITPDAVVGDLDSVCGRALRRYSGIDGNHHLSDNAGARSGGNDGFCSNQRIVIKSDDQETNDLTKAFNYVLDTWPEAGTIHILGATGRSEAHTIGNISLLMEYESSFKLADKGIKVDMVSDYSTVFAVTDSCEFHVGEGRKVSIFSPDPDLRIKSEGLVWPTDNVIFDNWWKGTLNKASGDVVKLHFNRKSKAIIILD